MAATVESFQLVLDSHRWVPLPSVGLASKGNNEESQDDMAPPYSLMEHPPLAIFVNGVLAALNELRHCAPINLKSVLALELVQALQTVSDYLVLYNKTRMLRDSESTLFLAMCRAFIEVACPYCVRCFSRCYPGGVSLTELNKAIESVCNLVGRTASGLARRDSGVNGSFSSEILPSNHPSLNSGKQASLGNHADSGSVVVENGGPTNSDNGPQISE